MEPKYLKDALKIGLTRLRKDIEILSRIPSKEYPLSALQTTADTLEALMNMMQGDIPYETRPLNLGLYLESREVELGKVQHGNGRDAEAQKSDGKSRQKPGP